MDNEPRNTRSQAPQGCFAKTSDSEQQILDTEQQKRVHTYICDRCGVKMIERNCKVICPNCGNRFDCSDLNIYFD